YDEVLPGCAERIISAWEEESQHRRQLDSSVLKQDSLRYEQHYRFQFRGQVFALSLAILFFSGSMFLVYQGHSTGGIAVLIGEIVALVGVFVLGRREQARNATASSTENFDNESEPR
ncbi:MAG: DUF2335 domain-containing protein, partial [bacterium]|nr:DUF2335 domain-containing protein [bacterium]